jgi:tetratricopeptide (TPR) repeat protein
MVRICVTLLLTACLGGLLGGCASGLGGRAEPQLLAGYEAYRAGDNSGALRSADSLLKSNHQTRLKAEAYYLRGLARERLGDQDGATEDWRRACDASRSGEVRAHALLALADVAYAGGDLRQARSLYRECMGASRASQPIHEEALNRLRRLDGEGERASVVSVSDRTSTAWRQDVVQTGQSPKWTVQAGAFTREGNARALVDRLTAGGLPACRELASRGAGQTYHVVRVGPYASYATATEALSHTRRYQREAFIRATR